MTGWQDDDFETSSFRRVHLIGWSESRHNVVAYSMLGKALIKAAWPAQAAAVSSVASGI
jgi:hypothetical protein